MLSEIVTFHGGTNDIGQDSVSMIKWRSQVYVGHEIGPVKADGPAVCASNS